MSIKSQSMVALFLALVVILALNPTIINNIYWSRAMRLAGYHSVTFTNGYYDSINKREDWDILIQDKYKGLLSPLI